MFLSSGGVESQDGLLYLSVARNLYYTGEPTAPPDESAGGMWFSKNIQFNTQLGKDGKTFSSTGIGYSLAFLPAVAITDLVYKYYNLSLPQHFPLESDWMTLMLAGFTNSFFAAGLGVILFLYLIELKLNKKQALLIVFVGLFATNLLPYSKHIFAHMMFVMFLVMTAYFIKLFSVNPKNRFLFFAGISYGINLITYNPTSVLSALPLVLYYFLLVKPKFNTDFLKKFSKQLLIALIGFLPFVIIFYWHQQIISLDTQTQASAGFYQAYAKSAVFNLPISTVYEGVFGQLLSPGRSILLYSPILILLIIYWFKLGKKNLAEIVLFLSLSTIYVLFYSVQRQFEEQWGFMGYWGGELSWGPRYLLPLIPFGLLLVGLVYTKISKQAKLFIFTPLAILGLGIAVLGILIPYEVKLHNLDKDVYIAGQHYTWFNYPNLLPKFSPVLSHAKKLQFNLKMFPKTLDHGKYNVKFYDGFDFPFSVGVGRWREIEREGYISFDDNSNEPLKTMAFDFINHKMNDQASSSARLTLILNDQPVLPQPEPLKPGEQRLVEATIAGSLKPKDNHLYIKVDLDRGSIYNAKSQMFAMFNFYINGKPANFESIDYPYLSNFGPAITGVKYQNYGQLDTNPWKAWVIHNQVFVSTLDFWWIKTLYYWDMPKKLILSFALINILLILGTGYLTLKSYKKLK